MANYCIKKALGHLTNSSELYTNIKDDSSLPATFGKAGTWIALARELLQLVSNVDPDDDALYDHFATCKDSADKLETMFETLSSPASGSKTELYEKAVKRIGGKTVERLLNDILQPLQALVEASCIPANEEQKKALSGALKDLTAILSPVSEGRGDHFTFSGVGDMFNKTGPGPQTITKGGVSNIADTIHQGK